MSTQNAIILASSELAASIGMEKSAMLDTFRAQCFRNAEKVSDSQLAAFVSIAREMKVNPLLPGMLYAYPTTGGGIVPMMGPDGVYKKLMEHPSVDGWDTTVFPEDSSVPPTHATTVIFLKGGAEGRQIKYTAYFNEWKVNTNPNWNSRPRHMLGLRSLKQAARQVIHGLPYDEDDRVIGDLVNVTGTAETTQAEQQQKRAEPPKRSTRGVASVAENTAAEEKVASAKEANAVIDVPATTVTETAKPAEKAAEKPAHKEEKQAAPADVKPVVLEADKEITVEGLIVQSFVVKPLKTSEGEVPDSVAAEVTGAYTGKVYHFSGGKNPAWQIDKPVTLRLRGRGLKNGTVSAIVQSIEITGAASDSENLE